MTNQPTAPALEVCILCGHNDVGDDGLCRVVALGCTMPGCRCIFPSALRETLHEFQGPSKSMPCACGLIYSAAAHRVPPAPEQTVDVCENCGGEFGLSEQDSSGFNSTCVHCGNNIYITRDRDEWVDPFPPAAPEQKPPIVRLHYFVPTEASHRCGVEGCELDLLAHPETPMHNAPAPAPQPAGDEPLKAFRNSVGFQFGFVLYSGLDIQTAIDHVCSAAEKLIEARVSPIKEGQNEE